MANEVEVKIVAARDIKNVNWRHGPNQPYAVVWVDPKNKSSTGVDQDGDTCANWDQTLVIPVPAGPIDDCTLYIDIVHAGPAEDTKKLIGSARLKLSDISFGERTTRSLQLKRPSGRPHGKVDIKVTMRESRYRAPESYYAPPYGVPPAKSTDYGAPPPSDASSAYGGPYGGAPARNPYYAETAPPSGYPYSSAPSQPQQSYGQPNYGYGQAAYGQSQAGYGQSPAGYGQSQAAYGQSQAAYGQTESSHSQVPEEKKKSKFGIGTGLAVGAVAGVLGGIALVEGAGYVEDRITDKVAEKVEEDLGYDDDW